MWRRKVNSNFLSTFRIATFLKLQVLSTQIISYFNLLKQRKDRLRPLR